MSFDVGEIFLVGYYYIVGGCVELVGNNGGWSGVCWVGVDFGELLIDGRWRSVVVGLLKCLVWGYMGCV